jgi:hypothetical protein
MGPSTRVRPRGLMLALAGLLLVHSLEATMQPKDSAAPDTKLAPFRTATTSLVQSMMKVISGGGASCVSQRQFIHHPASSQSRPVPAEPVGLHLLPESFQEEHHGALLQSASSAEIVDPALPLLLPRP